MPTGSYIRGPRGKYVSKTGQEITGIKRRYTFRARKKRTSVRAALLRYRIRKYGLTATEYVELLVKQDFRCAICRKPQHKTFCVDHDKDTGEVRGLLCGNCNRAIGYLHHDTESLRRAIAYLDRHDH